MGHGLVIKEAEGGAVILNKLNIYYTYKLIDNIRINCLQSV